MKIFSNPLNHNCLFTAKGIPLPIENETILKIVFGKQCLVQDKLSKTLEIFDDANIFLTNRRLIIVKDVSPTRYVSFFVALDTILDVSTSQVVFMMIDGSMGFFKIADSQQMIHFATDLKNIISNHTVNTSSILEQRDLPLYFKSCHN